MRDSIRTIVAQHPVWIASGALLLVALLATYAGQWMRISNLQADLEAATAAAVARTEATIQRDFDRRVASVRRRARQFAQHPRVVEGLQTYAAAGQKAPLTRFAADQNAEARMAIEVYGADQTLVAWNGFSMPIDRHVVEAAFEQGAATVVRDDAVRWGIAAWWPVYSGETAVGAVRVVQLIRFRAPVQNQFLQDYSLERQWRIQTGHPVEVTWGLASGTAGEDLPLRVEGTVVGRVDVPRPTADQLIRTERQRFADLLALWQVGLLFWLFAALWMWYRRVDATVMTTWARWHAVMRFAFLAAAWWGLRYLLIAMKVPDRWQTGKAPLAPLFDPTHLASPIGGGVMESTGDLLVTGLFAILFTVGFLDLASRFRVQANSMSELWGQIRITTPPKPSPVRFFAVLVVVGLVELGLVHVLSRLAERAVLDSTLDYLVRTGLLPEPLVLAALCGLLLITVAVILCGAGVFWIALYALGRYRPRGWQALKLVGVGGLVVMGGLVAVTALMPSAVNVTVPVALMYPATTLGVALLGLVQGGGVVKHFTLRSLLPGLIVLTALLYPLLYQGMDAQRRGRMVDATASFAEGSDPRVLFSLEQVLRRANDHPVLRAGVREVPGMERPVDSVATELLQGSLVASLSQYEASLVLLDSTGTLRRRYTTAGQQGQTTVMPDPPDAFDTLRDRYVLLGRRMPVVDRLDGQPPQRRAPYAGLAAVPDTAGTPIGWVLAQVEPRSLLPGTGTPYPRVLLPEGLYNNLSADLAMAEFRNGVLTRSLGAVERAQLPRDARQLLNSQSTAWQTESSEGRSQLVYYRRVDESPDTVVAARMPAIMAFDHLYYLLRLAFAGLCIAGPFYLFGLYLRYQQGVLPAPRVRFRDKMLDAFLVVGSIAVLAVGIVGARVIVQENERAVRNQLQQHLGRVEEALLTQAQQGERLHRIMGRTRIDSLSRRVGLDLNLYADGRLVASSRPRLVRDRLIDTRLPASAYQALYLDAYRFTTTEERFGAFRYTVGFQALPDASGQPRYVLAVPTLPEQERIQDERARTLAYLLGALLLLIIVIMVTALFLSNALAQPIARLRAGLEAVGKGRYARRLPVDTRDEIGELVETFNDMREQLAESRRRLAQQERELAWREMARQVAHEIKNPLTPMKLSVQHMRRAFQRLRVPAVEGAPDDDARRFTELFNRITSTLIEQINALARIANEFSSFARLPERVIEPLDLNEVVREAATLMQEEAEAAIDTDLHGGPLVVEADREELRRIYINLIKNAIQAVPSDRTAHIRVATARDAPSAEAASRAQSWVADNGVGIPRAERDKIFQPNFSTKTSGTGLGLAIARKTIRELDGDIGFHTQEGKGSTFWIHLPLAE